jgi:hypothetical protein
MLDQLREALRALRTGGVHPSERRPMIASMRDTLVQARVGLGDLRSALETTRARLAEERRELETVRRRKGLAAGIKDAETVAIAERYEAQHSQRVTVLEQKVGIQETELAMAEREVEEMTAELKLAAAGIDSVPTGAAPPGGVASGGESSSSDGDAEDLRQELDSLARARRRAATEAEADEKLAALKRRMEK